MGVEPVRRPLRRGLPRLRRAAAGRDRLKADFEPFSSRRLRAAVAARALGAEAPAARW